MDSSQLLICDGGEPGIREIPFNRYSLITMNLALYLLDGSKYPEFDDVHVDPDTRDSMREAVERANSDLDASTAIHEELEASDSDATLENMARAVVDDRYTVPEVYEVTEELVESFPREEPVTIQAALWQRAIVMLHMFDDGNHRTGFRSVRMMIEENDLEMDRDLFDEDLEELSERTIETSKRARQKLRITEGIDLDDVRKNPYERKDVFGVWLTYFQEILEQP